MKKILIAISQSFPYGAAYAARTRALSKLLQKAGYYVDILCDYPSDGAETEDYGNIFTVTPTLSSGIKALVYLPIIYRRKLDLLLSNNKYELIVSRSMFDRFDMVLSIARKHHVPIILESCEWYDVRGFRRGKKDIRYYQFQHCFNKSYNKVDGVIAISRLLEEHYQPLVKRVVRIPGIHEVYKLPYRIDSRGDNEIRFLFAGNIFGEKEQFTELLTAMSRVQLGDKIIKLNVYGTSKQDVINSLDEIGRESRKMLGQQVVFHGMVSQSKMADICAENDFGVFFRPDRRSSHAGFPTKLGEYLAAGTPVITNDTGDISLIVYNSENGYLLKDMNVENIKDILEKCCMQSEDERILMRKKARKSAEEKMDFSVYSAEIRDFINSFI